MTSGALRLIGRMLTNRLLVGGVAIAALLGGAYYVVYERGASAERTACEQQMTEIALAVSKAALETARRDYERNLEIQEALREERAKADEYRRALRAATDDIAYGRLDEYRLCVAQSLARGTSPEACADFRDGGSPGTPGAE